MLQKKLRAPLLVVAISVANRAIAIFLYNISLVFILWLPWTIVLVALSCLDWRKMKA